MSVVVWAQNTSSKAARWANNSRSMSLLRKQNNGISRVCLMRMIRMHSNTSRTGAIVGAAFVAARYTESTEGTVLLEWCQEVFDRAVSAIRKPSTWIARGSVLSMDSTVFAAHGYASLLARGHNVGHCQRALRAFNRSPRRRFRPLCLMQQSILPPRILRFIGFCSTWQSRSATFPAIRSPIIIRSYSMEERLNSKENSSKGRKAF